MAFLFGSSTVKEPLSKEVIKERLETYQRVVNEPVDYVTGDYVVLKPDVLSLGLTTGSPQTSYSYPTICYILEVDYQTRGVVAAYVQNKQIQIAPITKHFYKKAAKDIVIPEDLARFVSDKSISKWVSTGELVRARLHYHIFDYNCYSSSGIMTPDTAKVYEPVIVVKTHSNGQITVAGCSQKDDKIIEHTVYWYTLAPYVG